MGANPSPYASGPKIGPQHARGLAVLVDVHAGCNLVDLDIVIRSHLPSPLAAMLEIS